MSSGSASSILLIGSGSEDELIPRFDDNLRAVVFLQDAGDLHADVALAVAGGGRGAIITATELHNW